MRRMLLLLSCLFLVIACSPVSWILGGSPASDPFAITPGATPAPVNIPHATITYYDISGSTAAELRADLNRLHPTGFDGARGDATTKWNIHWDWPGYGESDCRLDQVKVSYQVKVIFPRWKPPADADPELVARWATYTLRLAEHESGHVDYLAAKIGSVEQAIRGATCQTAEAAAQAALAPFRQHDLDYDADTNHGETQGARFP
jgi:predicted secreted Zn-dependent protease